MYIRIQWKNIVRNVGKKVQYFYPLTFQEVQNEKKSLHKFVTKCTQNIIIVG